MTTGEKRDEGVNAENGRFSEVIVESNNLYNDS